MKIPKRPQSDVGSIGSDKFLKLKDGESIEGIFRGNIYDMGRMSWNGKGYSPDEKGSSRYRLNFVVYETKDKVLRALVWEFGITIYDIIEEINVSMPLETTRVKITRKGSGTDTAYILFPLGEVKTASLSMIEKVDLNILDMKPKEKAPHQEWEGIDQFGPTPPDNADSDNLPF